MIRCHDQISLIVKAQSDQSYCGNNYFRFGVRSYFDYASMPATAGRDIEVALAIKCQPLRAAKPRKKSRHFAIRRYAHYGIEAGKRRPRNVQMTVRPECQMISRHARFKRCECRCLADFVDAKDRAAPVSDVHAPFLIEGYPCGYAEIVRERFGFFERRDAIDSAIVAAGDEDLAVRAE